MDAARLIGPLDRVERAAADLRRGLPVCVETPEGGLLVLAAERARDDMLAGLAAAAEAPLGVYLSHRRAATLKIRLYTTPVVLVPLRAGEGAMTARHLADPTLDLRFPLAGPFGAARGPLPEGAGAALALTKLAGLLPAFVAPLEATQKALAAAEAEGLARLAPDDIEAYEPEAVAALERLGAVRVPLDGAEATRIVAFRGGADAAPHLAVIVGEPDLARPVLVRLHSECLTGDLLGSLKCDCGDQLRGAIARMAAEGSGILLYLAQEGRGIGLMNKLRAYGLQDQGFDTIEANERQGFEADERRFAVAGAMLRALGVGAIRLLTNNPDKVSGLAALGVPVVERVPHAFPANEHNRRYLATKAEKSGHQL